MRPIPIILLFFLLLAGGCSTVEPPFRDVSDLLDRVEKLNIGQNGYILGKALTDIQKDIARKNPVDIENPALFKFRQDDLYVIAEKQTHRPLILYEQQEDANREEIRAVVGELFMEFGDPTVFSHDKIIYWAYGQTEKISETTYRQIKDEKRKMEILATVKLTSDLKIMEKTAKGTGTATGSIYYIISSPPVLKAITSKDDDTGTK